MSAVSVDGSVVPALQPLVGAKNIGVKVESADEVVTLVVGPADLLTAGD